MIRAGIGGWTYAPWRGSFYPAKLKQAEELHYASRQVTAIEINSTFYRAQSQASFKKWRADTPEDFIFSVKGHRAVVNARKLAETGEQLDWFFKSGVFELGEKLGPLLWQLAPFKTFDREDLGVFLKLLPRKASGLSLKHVLEIRHESFLVPEFLALLREENVAVAYADSEDYPAIADVTADFVYARLQRAEEKHETGYAAATIKNWAERARLWEAGGTPEDLPKIGEPAPKTKRPVFIFMINGAKIRAPAAAQALLARLGD